MGSELFCEHIRSVLIVDVIPLFFHTSLFGHHESNPTAAPISRKVYNILPCLCLRLSVSASAAQRLEKSHWNSLRTKNTMVAAVSLHGLCVHLEAMLSTTIHVVKPIAIHHIFLMGCTSPLDRPKFGRLGPFASTPPPTVGAKIGVLVVSTHTRLDRDLNLLFWFLLLRLTIAACSVQRPEWRC